MSAPPGQARLDVAGPAAPPRSNGELVFAEPWESRAFGMAVALADAGLFGWDDFRDRLIGRIGAWEAEHGVDAPDFRYYACWLDALEDVLVDGAALTAGDVAARSAAFAERPAGHDHDHADHAH
ncbi:nitrile hydratase accessory protein [Actinomycetospora sp. TBRC 11914]|uniref:nitrile hydratase accessory protein n=1 Tax=Actinomycetospora sp. TBRC 11914 TaxID=2729387 RepID=UPI00145C6DFA|nr:nitrile hydratase accessory protein [Actinomycetospora sp. TBRC 11914]NMO92078.1 nitrile hydratase accessory protein [Actinomycetospora sp. TBRC 11914]